MRYFASLLFLVACGSSKPAPETTPPAASMLDCAQVADHVAKTVAAEKPRPGATLEAVENLVANRCRADRWSDATMQCLHRIATVKEGRACASTMTEEQKVAIAEQAKALRTDAPAPAGGGTTSSDWVEHVVEEPGTPTR